MAKFDKKRLRREIAAELRQKDRARLRELRDAIAKARARRRERMAQAVAFCRAGRVAVRERARERRQRALAELRAALDAERAAARATCAEKKAAVRSEGLKTLEHARQVLDAERVYQRELRAAESTHRQRSKAHRARAHERRAESDDEVRQNLPAELVPVFNRMRRHIKGTARRSRTEAFLHWAEENPGEVVAMQGDDIEREVSRLVKEHDKQERKLRSRKRYQRSAEELAEELAKEEEEVPF
ncbi:MAG: hypothetical protein IPM35_17115 [Myxococcales bacterium]|nr:hypothetical protein [Myxococcales bacterium]